MEHEKPIKDYTVCFLFDKSLSTVLLQTKSHTTFAGKLNGVGGKIEPGETPEQGAIREILEETGISNLTHLTWLGTLHLPMNCEKTDIPDNGPADPACVLYYYAAIVDDSELNVPADGETVRPYGVSYVLSRPVTDDTFAGSGDVQYFIQCGLNALTQKGA